MTDRSETIRAIAQAKADLPGALLPILHEVQETFGYLPKECVPAVASVLNLSRAEVHGVITFYHLFRSSPPGEKTVFVCRAEACQSMGAQGLIDHARSRLGIDFHETTPDGRYSLEPIYCLGNCACSPAIMIGETVYGRVTPQRWDQIFEASPPAGERPGE